MLTTDLVRVRRRAGRITVPPLRDAERERLLRAAEHYLALAAAHVDQTRGELESAWDRVPHTATDYKLLKGLRKLVRDRCTFEVPEGIDARALRQRVFRRAAATRRALEDDGAFDRQPVIAAVGAEVALAPDEVDAALFADLKQNHRLIALDPISAPALVDAFELCQQQAVLLRAASVVVKLSGADAAAYRALFRRLKFHRLLHRIERESDGYRIEIDGPFSLFQSVTKYGLQLALLLPALRQCGNWALDADIRWGKERQPLRFHLEGDQATAAGAAARLPDDVVRLRDGFERLQTPWTVEVADDLLDLPGVGLCVPDLVFVHRQSGACVFLEVLGYWSREAVWRRVELVQAGLPQPIIFAVSDRLRVSEAVLDDDLPGQLLVYKGVIHAGAVAERLGHLS